MSDEYKGKVFVNWIVKKKEENDTAAVVVVVEAVIILKDQTLIAIIT